MATCSIPPVISLLVSTYAFQTNSQVSSGFIHDNDDGKSRVPEKISSSCAKGRGTTWLAVCWCCCLFANLGSVKCQIWWLILISQSIAAIIDSIPHVQSHRGVVIKKYHSIHDLYRILISIPIICMHILRIWYIYITIYMYNISINPMKSPFCLVTSPFFLWLWPRVEQRKWLLAKNKNKKTKTWNRIAKKNKSTGRITSWNQKKTKNRRVAHAGFDFFLCLFFVFFLFSLVQVF